MKCVVSDVESTAVEFCTLNRINVDTHATKFRSSNSDIEVNVDNQTDIDIDDDVELWTCKPWPGGRCIIGECDYSRKITYYGKYAVCKHCNISVLYDRSVDCNTRFAETYNAAEKFSRVMNRVFWKFRRESPQAHLHRPLLSHLQKKILFQERSNENLIMLTQEANKFAQHQSLDVCSDDMAVSIAKAMRISKGEHIAHSLMQRSNFHLSRNGVLKTLVATSACFATYKLVTTASPFVIHCWQNVGHIANMSYLGGYVSISTNTLQRMLKLSIVPSQSDICNLLPRLVTRC